MARFQIGSLPSYYKGRVYEPGEVIEIEKGEKPSKTWIALDAPEKGEDEKAAKAAAKAAEKAAKEAEKAQA